MALSSGECWLIVQAFVLGGMPRGVERHVISWRHAPWRRNHFVSALKLFACGKATPKACDKQLKRHLRDGPVCQVMHESLYADEDGLSATQL